MNKISAQSFLQKNITEYIAHAQTVCTRPLLRGRGLGTRLERELDQTVFNPNPNPHTFDLYSHPQCC